MLRWLYVDYQRKEQVTRIFSGFFVVNLDGSLNKESCGQWNETSWRLMPCHPNDIGECARNFPDTNVGLDVLSSRRRTNVSPTYIAVWVGMATWDDSDRFSVINTV